MKEIREKYQNAKEYYDEKIVSQAFDQFKLLLGIKRQSQKLEEEKIRETEEKYEKKI